MAARRCVSEYAFRFIDAHVALYRDTCRELSERTPRLPACSTQRERMTVAIRKRSAKGKILCRQYILLLKFQEWTSIFGSAALTQSVIDRLTHRGNIFEFVGESYRYRHRLQQSEKKEEEKNQGKFLEY
jgi:hypothetical protein